MSTQICDMMALIASPTTFYRKETVAMTPPKPTHEQEVIALLREIRTLLEEIARNTAPSNPS